MVYLRYQSVHVAHMSNAAFQVPQATPHHIRQDHIPFSALNLSQLSLRVENTVAAIMRASTLASCASCRRERKGQHVISLRVESLISNGVGR